MRLNFFYKSAVFNAVEKIWLVDEYVFVMFAEQIGVFRQEHSSYRTFVICFFYDVISAVLQFHSTKIEKAFQY